MASADWMSRNLDRRVELLVPIEEPQLAHRIIEILDACFKDNTQASDMGPDGHYHPADTGRKKAYAMQAHLQRDARRRARSQESASMRVLEPHKPRK